MECVTNRQQGFNAFKKGTPILHMKIVGCAVTALTVAINGLFCSMANWTFLMWMSCWLLFVFLLMWIDVNDIYLVNNLGLIWNLDYLYIYWMCLFYYLFIKLFLKAGFLPFTRPCSRKLTFLCKCVCVCVLYYSF